MYFNGGEESIINSGVFFEKYNYSVISDMEIMNKQDAYCSCSIMI